MKRLCVIGILLAAPSAFADTEISVSPGLWTYDVTALIAGLPVRRAGDECVTQARSKRSLDQTAAALGEHCTIRDAQPIAGGYTFSLACRGTLSGDADGKITTDATRADLRASGWLDQNGQRVPVTLTGTAKRIASACTGN